MVSYRARHGERIRAVRRAAYDPKRRRDQRLRWNFGISRHEYNWRLAEQAGRCACCGSEEPGGRWGTFAVDHDHKTLEVRGLLCFRCNRLLGLAGDSTEVLAAAVSYLQGRSWQRH